MSCKPVGGSAKPCYLVCMSSGLTHVDNVCRVYHYSMANYVAILKKGMDMTPGGKDESAVPVAERLEQEVDLEKRVELLVETTSYVMFNYVAQVGDTRINMPLHVIL